MLLGFPYVSTKIEQLLTTINKIYVSVFNSYLDID